MKERLVKGRHVRGIIELLETQGRLQTLPELAPPGADLIRKPVYPTTWYQLRAFDDLLQSVHRYVFDGSEAAGQKMGRLLAEKYLATAKDADTALSRGAVGTGELLARYWKTHFNFGQVDFSVQAHDSAEGVRIRVTGFPDMSACHGQLVMGWCAEAFERACACKALLRVEERPWMHNSVLTYTLTPA